MKRIAHYLTLVFALILVDSASGQFLPYKDMFAGKPRPEPGTYFVVVGADWCPGCVRLKSELSALGMLVYEASVDKQRATSANLLQGRIIPQLIRFDVGRDISWRTYWEADKKSLSDFLTMPPPAPAGLRPAVKARESPIAVDVETKEDQILNNQKRILRELAQIRNLIQALQRN